MENTIKGLFESKGMSIIASLPENRIDLAQAAIDAGADALKFHVNVSHRASGNEFMDVNDYTEIFSEVRERFSGPMGIVLGDEIKKVLSVDTKALNELGFNYYSLYAKDIGSKLLLQKDLEHTVAVDDKFNFTQLRAIDSFNIQAIELSTVKKENYGEALSLEDLISYKNFRNNTDLPLIVPSQKKLVQEDLIMMQDIGINAIMLGAVTIGTTAESIFNTISQFTKIRD